MAMIHPKKGLGSGILGLAVVCFCLTQGCIHDPTCEDTAFAVERAVRTLHGQYDLCFPADYNAERFIADLKQNKFDEKSLTTLQSVTLEVMPNAECDGYFLVAHGRKSHNVLVWDDSSSMTSVDGVCSESAPAPPVPDHPAPQTCDCQSEAP